MKKLHLILNLASDLRKGIKSYSTFIKVAVVLALVYVLYFDLSHNANLPAVWAAFLSKLQGANLFLLLAVILLMPLNWLAETEKWHQIVSRYEPLSRWKALKAVLTGISFSLFTPNRMGEYGGRMLYIHPRNQWRAVVANLAGSFCQYMVLLAMGVLGSLYIMNRFEIVDPQIGQLLVAAAAIGFVVMLWSYYHLEFVIDFLKNLRVLRPFLFLFQKLNLGVIRQFSRSDLNGMLQWAGLRYLIYSTQYFLLLRFFGINTDIIGGFAGIAALFLLQTSIPLPPLASLVARGNIAILLWEQFGANEISALAATFSLWVINLVIPALLGTFSFFHVNIGKSLGYEEDAAPINTETHPDLHARPVGRA